VVGWRRRRRLSTTSETRSTNRTHSCVTSRPRSTCCDVALKVLLTTKTKTRSRLLSYRTHSTEHALSVLTSRPSSVILVAYIIK